MGIIRGGLLVIASVLFFIGLLVANSLFVISSSLDYKNVQENLVPVVTDVLEEEVGLSGVIEDKLPELEAYCENNSEFVFREEGETFDISCESVGAGSDAVVDEAIGEFVENIYYEDYDCGFFDCIKEGEKPFFLVSEKTKNYFQGKLYLVLVVLAILLASMSLLVESKTNLLLIAGSLLIVAALPFLKLESVIGFFADKSFLQFFTFLFTQSYFVFLTGLILGIVTFGLGITLKFFVVGFKVSDFFSKFSSNDKGVGKNEVKGIVKEEISKVKKKK